MSGWPEVRLDSIADVRLGRQRSPKDHDGPTMRRYVRAANVGWGGLLLDDVKTMNFTDDEMSVFRLEPGDLLLGEASGSAKEVGKPAIWNGEIEDCGFQNTLLRVRSPDSEPRYLLHLFKHLAETGGFARRSRGVGIHHLGREALASLPIPLPPIEDQRRIAAVLDQAGELRAKRQTSLALIDSLNESIFLDMFGDPTLNSHGYRTAPLGHLSLKFSDGPFGSNLKSSHYVESGVRVVRLQNIGVGRFVNDDAAYISGDHFAELRRHQCLPGDVLVGTLGDPNLRACMQPGWLEQALNKADCVQVRVDPEQATSEWLTALLNLPATERLAQALVLGQTRARISMGRLRTLAVPVPPLEEQGIFVERVNAIDRQEQALRRSSTDLDSLFASLQHRAFAGQL